MAEGQRWGGWQATGERRAGGTAEVFRAQKDGVVAAIKWARPGEGCAAALDRERAALLSIAMGDPAAGEWVITVIDAGIERGRPWVALPWFDDTLRGLVAREPGVLTMLRVCELATGTLYRLHQTGNDLGSPRLHRDVKPDNFLVAHDGRVVLADLGNARADSLADVVSPTVTFTPRYAPVEQTLALSRAPDPSVDAHALAVMVYACLVGSEPDSKGASVPYTAAGARLLGLSGHPDAEAQALRGLPLGDLVDLSQMAALTEGDANRLRNRILDELGDHARAHAAADHLLPALRRALEPDPDHRDGDLRKLAAALAAARHALGDDRVLPVRLSSPSPGQGARSPTGSAHGFVHQPGVQPRAIEMGSGVAPTAPPKRSTTEPLAVPPDGPDEDDPVARYALWVIGVVVVGGVMLYFTFS